MIKKLLTFVVIAGLFASCVGEQKTDDNQNGNTVSTEQTVPEIPLVDFNEKAGEYVDHEIIVSGIVDHVCKHGGKKILLVSDSADVHIMSDTRFNDSLKGSEIIVTGIVREERFDEAYCLKMEEDNIKSHSEGNTDDELFKRKEKHVASLRDSMKAAGVDYISNFTLEYVSHKNADNNNKE